LELLQALARLAEQPQTLRSRFVVCVCQEKALSFLKRLLREWEDGPYSEVDEYMELEVEPCFLANCI
jgi:hypothetical protein